MSYRRNQTLEAKKLEKHAKFKRKSDILLLKKKPIKKIEWPVLTYAQSSMTTRDRNIYTENNIKQASKVNVEKKKIFKYASWDRHSRRSERVPSERVRPEKAEQKVFVDDLLEQDLSDYLHQVLPKNEPSDVERDANSDLVNDLSYQFLDSTLSNIANPLASEEKETLDWEYVMANLLQEQLPSTVIDRIKRHMALTTGKNTPAITAMNDTPCELSDLTMTDTEVEMKNLVAQLAERSKKSSQMSSEDDEFSDVKWLMGLCKKDKPTQQKEIGEIHSDYTNRVLDLKSAFF